MSVLYCTVPFFAAALARRGDPDLEEQPLVLVGPEGRVFGGSAEALACGVVAGMAPRAAEVRCPEARLLDADVARCRAEAEAMFQVLEATGPGVEPHGLAAAYVDLGDLARNQSQAITLCREVGQAVRHELGQALQPALGWDSSKFTAQAAARRTLPGHLRAVDTVREREFLRPLPVTLLPLEAEVLLRLQFLGLRTLGQYASLPSAAVWQQFGRAGKLAHRCAKGKDDRPIIPRWQAPRLAAAIDFETPLVDRDRVLAALQRLVSPLLTNLRGNLQACGRLRLTAHFDPGGLRERERVFLAPTAGEGLVTRALGDMLDRLVQSPDSRRLDQSLQSAGLTSLAVALERIQDMVPEQLTLFPLDGGEGGKGKLEEVQQYLAARFGEPFPGNGRLRRAVLDRPGAPLPEWRVSWQSGGD